MDYWLTSDTHYRHTNVIKYCQRPFLLNSMLGWVDGNLDTEAMDETMIERWNEVVKPGDHVFHLGDLALGKHVGEYARELRRRLNGHITLVLGNHDRGPNVYRNAGFDEVGKTAYVLCTDQGFVWMRHHPPVRPTAEYSEYRLLLCGHVHEKWKQKGKLVNVGVDQWDFTPVNLDTLLAMT
jgi:calcineurin-like phosphoesterase family protein